MGNKHFKDTEAQRLIITRLRQGDESAMKQVFLEYYGRLHYFSSRLIGSEDDAEDIVQEAFLNCWINIREKETIVENLQAYLFRMVRNRCINYLERRQMLDSHNVAAAQHLYKDWDRQMDDIAVQEELFHHVSSYFSRLTPIQVQVMELLYIEGLSVAEAAAQLGTTENNIRNHKARALEHLRAIINTSFLLLVIFFLFFSFFL